MCVFLLCLECSDRINPQSLTPQSPQTSTGAGMQMEIPIWMQMNEQHSAQRNERGR